MIDLKSLRKYGEAPFGVAVIHGGPGAPGEMALVARELAHLCGTLEPLQSEASVEGQLEELGTILKKHGDLPITLIGHSWGAWLSFMFAARYPSHVNKVILVGSGPFEEQYALDIMKTRLSRLDEKERLRAQALMEMLDCVGNGSRNVALFEFGRLMSQADSYDPFPFIDEGEALADIVSDLQDDIFQVVWGEAQELRQSGELLKLGQYIQCPVVAIHGDYDPHPAAGVEIPLSRTVKNFRFILLENCGHEPWIERTARERFYEILKEELSF